MAGSIFKKLRGLLAKIKEAVQGFGRACHEWKAGENCGRDGRSAEEADRGAARRDFLARVGKLLEGETLG